MNPAPRFTVENTVGRLFEARIFKLASTEDIAAYGREFSARRLAAAGEPVLCADHRPVVIYPQKIATELADLFGTMNSRWARVAIVVAPSNATLGMQLQRIVREAENPTRRVFFEAAGAVQFLGEVLKPAETARARAFLGSGSVATPPR